MNPVGNKANITNTFFVKILSWRYLSETFGMEFFGSEVTGQDVVKKGLYLNE